MSDTAIDSTTRPDVEGGVHGSGDRASTAGPPVDRRAEVVGGIRAMLPWLVGVVPFGLVVGMTSTANGFSIAYGLATGATIYSGTAQITAIELGAQGAAVWVAVASVLAINARLVLYSSAIAPRWRGTSHRYRALAAYLLVDPSFAVGDHRYRRQVAGGHVFYLAAAITLWGAWHVAIAIGATAGAVVPSSWGLEYVVPLFLLAEVVAVAARGLPMHTGILVAILCGALAGTTVDRRRS